MSDHVGAVSLSTALLALFYSNVSHWRLPGQARYQDYLMAFLTCVIQVALVIGAIAILFLFVIMMFNLRELKQQSTHINDYNSLRISFSLYVLCFFLFVLLCLLFFVVYIFVLFLRGGVYVRLSSFFCFRV